MKKNVAVLMGGYSSEHDISIKSGITVYNNINTNNFIPFKIIIEKENWNLINNDGVKYPINKDDFSVKIDGKKIKFDIEALPYSLPKENLLNDKKKYKIFNLKIY